MILLTTAIWAAVTGQDIPAVLGRLSEEAEVYRRSAPQTLAEETLEQRATVLVRGQLRMRTREIVSEYTIGTLADSPDTLHEFRKVIAVDGWRLARPEQARRSLSLGLKSADDRARKRLLEEFQAHGLSGAAVDFGPLLLLFSKRQIGNYRFTATGTAWVGADQAVVLAYKQADGGQNLTVFSGRSTVRLALEGLVFLRLSDGLPLRITMQAGRNEGGRTIIETAAVDYVMTRHGYLAPVSVLHRTVVDGHTTAEDRFRYAEFRKFGAETEIKFTEVPQQ